MSSAKGNDEKDGRKGRVLMEGYLKKFKTMKKKYFVLRGESDGASARLEYYDGERKYKAGQPPKRTISLKTCFNINRKTDTKHKYVIALYTKDDVFCVVLDSEKQQEEWLKLLLIQQSGEDYVDGEPLRPIFEHVWRVKLQDKGLGDSRNLVGPYFVCLSEQTLSLVKNDGDIEKQDTLEFPLTHIRSCGVTESFFYIEVGRQSVTGPGELWMLTGDPNIARNMNHVILSAFTLRQNNQHHDPHRKRSSSATEASRPVGLLHRRTTHSGIKPGLASPYSGYLGLTYDGDYPSGPKVTISSSLDIHAVPVTSSLHARVPHLPMPRPASQRRHSVSAVSSSSVLGHSTVAAGLQHHSIMSHDVPDGAPQCTAVSHQRTKSCPVSETSVPIVVEPQRVLSQSHVSSPYLAEGDRRGSGGGMRRPIPGKSSTGPRERCDSMPSRNRTTSEGTHKPHIRPQSVHVRGVSYSPPGPCSTDSAGSSLSIDETDVDKFSHSTNPDERVILEENTDEAQQWPNDPELEAERQDIYVPMARPPASLSLPIHSGQRKISTSGILQGSPAGSSPSDYLPMSPGEYSRRTRPSSSPSTSDYLPMSPGDPTRRTSTSDYLHMSPSESSRCGTLAASPSASDYMPMSPADSKRSVAPGTSPSTVSDYLPMSPPGESGRNIQSSSMDYLPMSPADVQKGHSRGSSLAEDGYVPMAPAHSDDGYVDMDPVPVTRRILNDHHSDMSPGSSCSITSGTPSTDHQYLLEKVTAYFTPSEEEEGSSTDRPTRTYSFGSQPKGRLEVRSAAEAARARAFSMGTRTRPDMQKLSMRPFPAGGKFSSAPLLSSSWSGSARYSALDPMSDLMEIDYTKKDNPRGKGGGSFLGSNFVQNNSSADSGYMDMSSKSPPKSGFSKHVFSAPLPTAHECDSFDFQGCPFSLPAVISPKISNEFILPQSFPHFSSAVTKTELPPKIQAIAIERPYVEMRARLVRCGSESAAESTASSGSTASKVTRKNPANGESDYLPMTVGKCSSLPIAIRTPANPSARVSSSTTPPIPPNSLSLGAVANFFPIRRAPKRKTRKKQERHGSKENVTTPTTIFPISLNSPLSPKKTYTSDAEAAAAPAEATPEVETSNLAVPLSRVLRICSKENSPVSADNANVPVDDGDYAVMRPGAASTQRWAPPLKTSDETQSRLNGCGCPPASPRSTEKLSDTATPVPTPAPVRLAPLAKPENSRLKSSGESHSGVTRQVSTSSSSSTEVMSVKEGNERDITYASLDLGSENEEPRSPRPSPAPASSGSGPFTYAEIDFQKSESLRAPQSLNKKIRH